MNIAKLKNAMEKDIAKEMVAISFKVSSSIIKKTPVITGDARSSWNITEDKINTDIKKKVREKISGKKDIYITNSIHYILPLERGYPNGQAPKGMVAVTINQIKNFL